MKVKQQQVNIVQRFQQSHPLPGLCIIEFLGAFHQQLFSLLARCPRNPAKVLSAEFLAFRESFSVHIFGDHDSTALPRINRGVFLAYNGTRTGPFAFRRWHRPNSAARQGRTRLV
jgi:hypothetical protein